MWHKTPEELRAVRSAPFSSSDIEWRVSATNAEKTKGLAVPYQTPPQGAQQRPQQGQGSRPIPRGCLLVTGARLKNTINGGQRLSLQLADENNSVFQAYLRELDTRIAPGVLLSDAQITTQNKGGVVLYILESYQIVGSPEENAA